MIRRLIVAASILSVFSVLPANAGTVSGKIRLGNVSTAGSSQANSDKENVVIWLEGQDEGKPKAIAAITRVNEESKVVVLALGSVPVIDASGLVALESACEKLQRAGKLVVIAGPLPQPREVFDKANLELVHDHVFIAPTLSEALQLANDLILLTPEPAPRRRRPRSPALRGKARGGEGASLELVRARTVDRVECPPQLSVRVDEIEVADEVSRLQRMSAVRQPRLREKRRIRRAPSGHVPAAGQAPAAGSQSETQPPIGLSTSVAFGTEYTFPLTVPGTLPAVAAW